MTQMRIRFCQLGGHIHCRVFTRTLPTETWAKCGDLVFAEDEWQAVSAIFIRGRIELLKEEQ